MQRYLFFKKSSFPDNTLGGFVTDPVHHALAFHAISIFLITLVTRRNSERKEPKLISNFVGASTDSLYFEKDYSADRLLSNRDRKRIFMEGGKIFKDSYKDGITYFIGCRF